MNKVVQHESKIPFNSGGAMDNAGWVFPNTVRARTPLRSDSQINNP
jgi:hypothetical protein